MKHKTPENEARMRRLSASGMARSKAMAHFDMPRCTFERLSKVWEIHWRRAHNRLPESAREQLAELARDGIPLREAAKIVGSSDTTVRNHCRRWGIEFDKRTYTKDIVEDAFTPLTEEQIAKLYAGRRYEDVEVRYLNEVPLHLIHVPLRHSPSGCAAALCAEAGRAA